MTEERANALEDISIEITNSEKQKRIFEKNLSMNRASETQEYHQACQLTCNESPRRKGKREKDRKNT